MGEPGDRTALQGYLRKRGMPVNELATELGLDRSYVSSIVNGRASPTAVRRWAPKIAEVLGEPVLTLFPRPRRGPPAVEEKGDDASK